MGPVGLTELLLIVGIFALANVLCAAAFWKLFARTALAGLLAALALVPAVGLLLRLLSPRRVGE
jgi:hypothetical protein